MHARITNAQRTESVNTARIRRLVRDAARRLAIRTRGRLDITFLDARGMQRLNRQFLRQNRSTDVLSFRYDRRGTGGGGTAAQKIVGEIFISPNAAKTYAKQHDLSYDEELARYVVHGMLHWVGYEDKTRAQQQHMRSLEDRLLGLHKSHGNGAGDPAA